MALAGGNGVDSIREIEGLTSQGQGSSQQRADYEVGTLLTLCMVSEKWVREFRTEA
jgi:hypothetical protein